MLKLFSLRNKLSFLGLAFAWLLTLSSLLVGNVTSGTGSVNFDVNADGQQEMLLNSTGLGIGLGLSPSANLHVDGNAIVTEGVTVGDSTLNSANLYVNGSLGFSLQNTSSDADIEHSLVLAGSSSGNITLTLPTASTVEGRMVNIKKIFTSNEVTIAGGGYIDGQGGAVLTSGNMGYINLVSYSGNWMLLSISGNGVWTPWTPAEISTLLWLDANDASTITDSGGEVSLWSDKGSIGTYDYGQSVAGEYPKTTARTIGGLNALDFDGTDDFLIMATGFQMASDSMALMMIDYDTVGKNHRSFICQQGSDMRFGFQTFGSGNVAFFHNSTYAATQSAIPHSTGAHIHSGYRNGTETGSGVNGAYQTASKGADVSSLDNYRIGKSNGASASQHFDGAIGEIIVVSAYDSDTLKKLEGYLAHKWNQEHLLSSDHPYRGSPP